MADTRNPTLPVFQMLSDMTVRPTTVSGVENSPAYRNGVQVPVPKICLHESFEIWVDRAPDAIALVGSDASVSFTELDTRANRIAHALVRSGMAHEEPVGVLVDRSADLPLAFLGILKAGGAYVPLLADLPAQRLAGIARQAGMRRLIALDGLQPADDLLAALAENGGDAAALVLRPEVVLAAALAADDQRLALSLQPDRLAAILFTSGSTGTPKGVLIQHDACMDLAFGHALAQGITPEDRVLLSSSPAFILGLRELFLPLALGCAWVPASRALQENPAHLIASMERHGVTVALFTPSYLRLLDKAVPAGLRLILTAGERPDAEDARHYARHLTYWNLHGATEVCGTFCMHKILPDSTGQVPSGRPFPNTTVLLLDENGDPVGPDDEGEICVVSPRVSRGYLGQDDLTAETFIDTPLGRAYRTRDLGRWTRQGELLTLGRLGDTIKVSGQAVALGEIEHALLAHGDVRAAAVIQHKNRLVGFVTPLPGKNIAAIDWAQFLGLGLPAYIVPARTLVLASLPVGNAGKIDRTALIALAERDWQEQRGAGGPVQGTTETTIAAVWAAVLGLDPSAIGREDNFFRIGGSSLLAIKAGQQLQAAGLLATVRDILGSLNIAALAQLLTDRAEQPQSAADDHSDPEPLATDGQADFWVAAALDLPAAGSHVARALKLTGASPTVAAWQQAWTELVHHHPALRTGMMAAADGTVRLHTVRADDPELIVPFELADADDLEQASLFLRQQTALSFDLTAPPLVRGGLLHLAGVEAPLFWFVLHHAIADGMSATQLQQDLLTLLGGGTLAPALDGPRLASRAEQAHLASPQAQRDREYWLGLLESLAIASDDEAFAALPLSRSSSTVQPDETAAPLTSTLDAAAARRLTALANRYGASLHALLLTLLGAEAGRRTGRKHLLIGSGIATRLAGTENQIGHFVNLLPLPLGAASGHTLAQGLAHAQSTLTGAVSHGLYPARRIARDLYERRPDLRIAGQIGLVDIALTANPQRQVHDTDKGIALSPVSLPGEGIVPAAGLSLSFSHEPTVDGGILINLAWNTESTSRAEAAAWLESLAEWAAWLALEPARLDAPLPALLPAEQAWLASVEQGQNRPRSGEPAHRLVEQIADADPERAAVITRSRTVTYGELERNANRIAAALLEQGLTLEEPVAVLAENGPWLPAAILGIWKAGGVYVPLTSEIPPERAGAILQDTGAQHLLVLPETELPPVLTEGRRLLFPETLTGDPPRPNRPVRGDAAAYIIFTSGTTGAPKGTLVRHDGMINAVLCTLEALGQHQHDRIAVMATPSFDASLWEIGMALFHGLPMVPVTRLEREDPWSMKDLFRDLGVTVAFQAPSYLRVSQDKPFAPSMRALLVGGEAPSHDDLANYPGIDFWNAYGPTETSIIVSLGRIPADYPLGQPLHVGPPMANAVISIRRPDGSRVPPGCLGEVWLGGIGVCAGYLNNPDMTGRVFINTPEGRMYRSGDLGRWSPQGQLELAGRIDQQVKLHGQRVEPAEIEQHLQGHPAVRQASVIVDAGASGTKLLRGFVHLVDGAAGLSNQAWRDYLAERLPPHMVPTTIIAVPGIPFTPNGKLDRKQLLAALSDLDVGVEADVVRTPPRGALEQRIAEVWADLLGGGNPSDIPVAREDNFFALGGDSLRAIVMSQRLRDALGAHVSARDLFAAPTLGAFSARVERASSSGAEAAVMLLDDTLANEGETEFWTAQQAGLDTTGHIALTIRQVVGTMPGQASWNAAWDALVARQEGLRLSFAAAPDGLLRRHSSMPAKDGPGLEWHEAADTETALRLIRARQLAPFDMASPPLWRAGLTHVADNGEWLFWLALHHAISDGRSLGIIMAELARLLDGQELLPLTAGPASTARREQVYLAGPDSAQDQVWWSQAIAAAPDRAFLPLALDHHRDIDAGIATHRYRIVLRQELAEDLRKLARQHAISLYALLLALLGIEARQRDGRDWIVLGTTVSTMESAEDAALVGYGVNMLPLFLPMDHHASTAQFLQTCQQALSGALQHARYPFARICSEAWNARPGLRDPLRFPLFDIAVTENPPAPPCNAPLRFDRLSSEDQAYELTDSAHGQDIVLMHESLPDGSIALECHANAKLFNRESAASWLDGIQHWAKVITNHGDLTALPLPGTPAGNNSPAPLLAQASKEQPLPGLEMQIATLWAELLGTALPARGDNFFALGGNSLLAITMAHRLTAALDHPVAARDLFAAPALAAFATRLAGMDNGSAKLPANDGRKATHGEREFWTAYQAGLDTSGHIMPLIRRVKGPAIAEPGAWQAAWRVLVARHPALRCRLHETADGTLLREVLEPAAITQPFELSEAATTEAALAHIRARQAEPLDLSAAPLWRTGLVTVAQDGTALFWLAQHHATGDGRSFGVLTSELLDLLAGRELPELRATPETISAREQIYLAGEAESDATWWGERLASLPDTAFEDWDTDQPRTLRTAGSHHYTTSLTAAQAKNLATLARQQSASLHALLLALLAHVVHQRTGREDFLIGTTATVPESAAEAAVIHYGVNMLPLRFTAVGTSGFADLLDQTRDELNDALAHARYPFARIYQDLRTARGGANHPGRYPVFDIAITQNPAGSVPSTPTHFDPTPLFASQGQAGQAIHYELMPNPPGQDMVLTYQQLDDGSLLLDWQMNAALYHRDIGQFWLEGLAEAARWLADHPAGQTSLPSPLPAEQSLLTVWCEGATAARPTVTFADLFEAVVDRPDQAGRAALLTDTDIVSYAELDRQANALAHRLIDAGVRPGQVVAVLTGRSVRLPVAMLAVWKAGAVYLPALASLPAERILFMIQDAAAAAVLVLDGIEPTAGIDLPVMMDTPASPGADHRPRIARAAQDCAYILYTSGSTGQPKGVPLSHAGYVNLVLGSVDGFGLTPQDRCLSFAAPSFDVSLSDVGIPLAAGAALYSLTEDALSQPSQVAAIMQRQGITLADLPPSYLRLLDTESLAGLRILVTGGEAPLPVDVARLAGKLTYYNAYGATEASITSTIGPLAADQADGLDCGRPLPNTGLEIRHPATGALLPPGATGEIWLSGMGLASGYLNRPTLTEQAFLQTEQGPRYRTGDLGRWRGGGRLELLGRSDQQVKLNGIRIELGEIEAAIASHPAVSQAAALVAGTAQERQSLWAFVVPTRGELPSQADWKQLLGKRLPSYMIPAGLHVIAQVPMTPSGKIDRSALLAGLDAERIAPAQGSAPQPGLESDIAELWAELLACGPIHREDNFFSMGGHSLLAIALCHRLERSLACPVPAHLLFAAPVLADFAERVATRTVPDQPSLTPSDFPDDRATEGEREFWIAEQSGLDTSGFTMTLTLVVDGAVPTDPTWQTAWDLLVQRHDALRTHFVADADGETLRRAVMADAAEPFSITAAPDRATALALIVAAQAVPFAMERGPLCRAGLTHVAEDRPIFWLALHHSVGDGVSLSLLVRDLSMLLAGESLAPLVACYADSASSQNAYLDGAAADADRDWWREQLSSLAVSSDDAFTGRSADRPTGAMPSVKSDIGSHVLRYVMPAPQAERLRQIARGQGSSLHAVMLAMVGLEMKRRTGRSAFLVGTAASTRASAAEADVIGYYVNQLPVPFHLAEVDNPADAIAQTRVMMAQALAHSSYPFARIVRDFRQDHPGLAGHSRHPLFDLAVTENPSISAPETGKALRFTPLGRGELPPAGTLTYEASATAAPQDMLLIHEGLPDGGLSLSWLVNADLDDKSSAQAWLAGLLDNLATLIDQPVETPLPRLLPAELAQLEGWEQGEIIPAPAATIAELFSRHAAQGPDRPAIITDTASHSFADVEHAASKLAAVLCEHNVRPGTAVGVYTERSVILPLVVLAIWRAGGCYLPLVQGLPEDRLAFAARDANIEVLLVLDGLIAPGALLAGDVTVLHLDEALATPGNGAAAACNPIPVPPAGPAVILYTSGSTGTPKGVVMSHAGVMNLALGVARQSGITDGDRTLSLTSPAFDLWLSDLVGVWFTAGAFVPATRAEMEDLDHMREKMRRLGVTIATMTPSYLRMFEQAEFPDLRVLMTVGEAPILSDARFYAERMTYLNGYGPTENTAATTIGSINPDEDPLPAGRPLPNVRVMILDEQGERVPPGSIGEAWIGGASLAIGYANRPDLTGQAFVSTPFGRMYRTGDMARWRSDGQLVVLGRIDGQVKLRGQRVELGEIEQSLIAHPLVSQAAVVVGQTLDGGQTLWAFVVPAPGESEWPELDEWKAFLGKDLPGYMIPAGLHRVDEIPVTVSGKIDRKALISRIAGLLASEAATPTGAAPVGPVENTVAEAWASILGRPLPSRVDHFFELGGDSLKAIAVITRLRQRFDLQINDLYEHPVLEDFALCCKARPDHIGERISAAAAHWRDYQDDLVAYEASRAAALAPAEAAYAERNRAFGAADLARRADYRRVLLTGATGYVGVYLLRRLLATERDQVTALVRAADDQGAVQRLLDAYAYYFGPEAAARLAKDERLVVRAGDLRQPDLGLGQAGFDNLAEQTDAILHSAANVRHFGHYRDFQADNVDATKHLVDLAAMRGARHGGATADLHLISTVSIFGALPEAGFRLFTEYDSVPDQPDRNYYIRSKQEAERLAERARDRIGNVCIHRVGNIVFAADGGPLQRNIRDNAFFRMLGALAKMGVVPDDSHVWLCHVDVVAAAVVALAETPALANLTHHVEHARRDSLADFITGAASVAGTVQSGDFGTFLERVAGAVERPELENALSEILEAFGLLRGISPQPQGRRLEVRSERTQHFLSRMGIAWPEIPHGGQAAMLAAALELLA